MRWLAIPLILIGGYAIYSRATGNDPVTEVGDAIASSLTTVSESLADAIRTFVDAITLPIRVPAQALAEALERMAVIGGRFSVAVFVLLYFYLVTTPLTRAKPNPRIVKRLLGLRLASLVIGYTMALGG